MPAEKTGSGKFSKQKGNGGKRPQNIKKEGKNPVSKRWVRTVRLPFLIFSKSCLMFEAKFITLSNVLEVYKENT